MEDKNRRLDYFMLQGSKDENISSVDTFEQLQKFPPDLFSWLNAGLQDWAF